MILQVLLRLLLLLLLLLVLLLVVPVLVMLRRRRWWRREHVLERDGCSFVHSVANAGYARVEHKKFAQPARLTEVPGLSGGRQATQQAQDGELQLSAICWRRYRLVRSRLEPSAERSKDATAEHRRMHQCTAELGCDCRH